jgi:hypothetical protein
MVGWIGLEQGCLGEVIVGLGGVEVLIMVSRYEITLVLLCDIGVTRAGEEVENPSTAF